MNWLDRHLMIRKMLQWYIAKFHQCSRFSIRSDADHMIRLIRFVEVHFQWKLWANRRMSSNNEWMEATQWQIWSVWIVWLKIQKLFSENFVFYESFAKKDNFVSFEKATNKIVSRISGKLQIINNFEFQKMCPLGFKGRSLITKMNLYWRDLVLTNFWHLNQILKRWYFFGKCLTLQKISHYSASKL